MIDRRPAAARGAYTLAIMPRAVNASPHEAPPRASFAQMLGPDGGWSLLLALATGALGLGLPVLLRLPRVLARAAGDERRASDAIVVFGRVLETDLPSAVFRARLEHAAALFRAGFAPRVVVAGGLTAAATVTEAAAGRRYLLGLGLPGAAILVEERSQHTLENLFYVRALLAQEGGARLLLVSDPLHLARVAAFAEGLGLDFACSPAVAAKPRRGSLHWWVRAAREAFLLHWYYLGRALSRAVGARRPLARVT